MGERGHEIPALIADDTTYDLRSVTADIDAKFWKNGGVQEAANQLAASQLPVLRGGPSTRWGSPVSTPGKIVCIGLNYRDHAAETAVDIPTEPIVFLKDPMTVIGPFDDIVIPRRSRKTDWEVELGVIIGSEARYLDSPSEAPHVIGGYVLSHDVSEREFQLERGGQWDKGKSCETFNPLGTFVATPDEINDPQNIKLRLSVNGVVRQDGTTAQMIFSVNHIIWYLSQFMVLRPGDLINTGTPAGVALGLPGQPYLRAGDVVDIEVDGLGRARQTLVPA